jgi:uncharacterized protein DUF2637
VGVVKLSRITEQLPVVVLALISAYGSFSHIAELARRSGQEGAMAWATAVAIDLVCVCAAREIRRDRKAGKRSILPLLVLVGGISLSLLANVAEAPSTVWGKTMSAVPALALVAAVSLLERRGAQKSPSASERPREARVTRETKEVVVTPLKRAPTAPKASPAVPTPVEEDLMERARKLARTYQDEVGRPISRDALRQRLGVSTNRATALLRELKQQPVAA